MTEFPPNKLQTHVASTSIAQQSSQVFFSSASNGSKAPRPKTAYMFASVRKKDLGQMENDQAEKDLGQLEHDLVEKQSGYETTEIPSTFMEDTTSIVTENILEDQKQEPLYSMHGWREKLGWTKK